MTTTLEATLEASLEATLEASLDRGADQPHVRAPAIRSAARAARPQS